MRLFGHLILVLLFPLCVCADTLNGVVVGPDGKPIAGATISVAQRTTKTNAEGRFGFELPRGQYTIRAEHDGFQARELTALTGSDVSIALSPALEQSIVVSGIRAEHDTPVTKSDVTRAQIEQDYYGQDIPMLLRDTPSISSYAEGGVGGAGYSYITVRGISSSRINFTLDGVPLADSEDMSTYFVDFPDLARSLQSIQVQRGTGTSTVGAGAFGGSINLESIAPSADRSTDVWLSGGSFGTKVGSVGFQSGDLPGGLLLYGRVSAQETNGFREHSGVIQHNVFLSAAKQSDNSQWKLTGFTARESQLNSYFAADSGTLQTDLRANPMQPEERDSFGYNLTQLEYLRAFSATSNLTASAFFQRGYGWYRLFDDEANKVGLRQYGLDGLLLGSMVTYSSVHGRFGSNYGLHVNEFRRVHTRDLVGGPRDYYDYGTKSEINGFAKYTFDTGRWHLYSDNQLRTTDFRYHGDVATIPPGGIRWTFFNPKIGARYALTARSGVYASAGISGREPARIDLYQGEDDASVPHDLHAVHPERLLDLEAGWDLQTARGSLGVDVYAMEFHNEIAATGQLSPVGLPLRRNVDRSYRRGVEISNSLQIAPKVRLVGNASVSRNRIHHWTQYYDAYDANGNLVGSQPVDYFNVNPLLTPAVLVNQSIEVMPASRLMVGVTGRYQSKSYLDNTNNDAFVTPSFFIVEANVSVDVWRAARLSLQVNNVLNNKRFFPSGYDYVFFTPDGTLDGISYLYPQATRNAVLTLHWSL